ncbi:site-specific integrase [Pseudonocardia sp. McavD-2-B]|uniref:tyrosine-type recombinase/integrase n=1 Tax=Pseudonocardia sp. McavD-2-B TaxID=2954499 RepID=UPI00209864B4|nr:site-specific integrase [Pseudonocardia sp. McavD-2-B]MCO7192293.1 site-specific integrase [Pseudonocardia sp. McavD-2-B]
MAGRPPLPIGTHGKIVARDVTPAGQRAKLWQAHTYYRDPDGKTRRVKRTGGSKSAAENALRAALSDRQTDSAATLSGDSRVSAAAAVWFEQCEAAVAEGELAPNTLRLYESAWRLHIEPAVGELRLRELTVSRCEAWKVELRKRKGAGTVRTSKAVLSGVAGYAARMGAIGANPVRDTSPVRGKRKRAARAMTLDERRRWLDAMEADERASRWAVPDLTRFLLATGVRIGEALAVTWDEVDLDAGSVRVEWHIIRVKGEGLIRATGAKSEAGDRELFLPRWAVDMLLRRRVESAGAWPVFPDSLGGWRDPSNMSRALREARDAAGFGWVTSHVFRQTVLTVLDDAGVSRRSIADQAGHADPSMTERNYMQRGKGSARAAEVLDGILDETA